jgi:hypothetical protein
MITRTEAERIAHSIHIIRPDWPVASLATLITRDLATWSLLEIYVGLAHVAIERTADNTGWLSQTPARVKENGPWRQVMGTDGNLQAAKDRAARELAERKQDIRTRTSDVANCTICDDEGRLETGWLCRHDLDTNERAQRAKERADRARAEIRPMRQVGDIAKEITEQKQPT